MYICICMYIFHACQQNDKDGDILSMHTYMNLTHEHVVVDVDTFICELVEICKRACTSAKKPHMSTTKPFRSAKEP